VTPTPAATAAKRRAAIWLAVGLGLLFLVAANAHLVSVAVTSQPECVDHVRPGEMNRTQTQFSAARSSCSPRREIPQK
jgi:uncharacterized membrane protein YhiD involved in acid resistance